MKIQRIGRGAICVVMTKEETEKRGEKELYKLAESAFRKTCGATSAKLEISAFSKDGNLLFFARKKEIPAIHGSVSQRLCKHIIN